MRLLAALLFALLAGCAGPALAQPVAGCMPGQVCFQNCSIVCESADSTYSLDYAYKFDGATSVCSGSYALGNPLGAEAQVTIAAWVRPVVPAAFEPIWAVMKQSAGSPHHITQFGAVSSTYRWVNDTGASSNLISSASVVNTGTWQFVVYRVNTDTDAGEIWVGDQGTPSLTEVSASSASDWSPLEAGVVAHDVWLGAIPSFTLYSEIEVAQVGAWASWKDPESLWNAGQPADWSSTSPGFHYEPDESDDGTTLANRPNGSWTLTCTNVTKVAGPSAL